jgi:beta-galactosidase
LKVNGQSIGSKTSTTCIFKWPDIELKEGQNTIEAITTRDGKTFTDKCEWRLSETPKQGGEPNG